MNILGIIASSLQKVKFGVPARVIYDPTTSSFTEKSLGIWYNDLAIYAMGTSNVHAPNSVQYEVENTGNMSDNTAIGLDIIESLEDQTNYDAFAYFIAISGGQYYAARVGFLNMVQVPAQTGDKIRLQRVIDTVKAQYFRDGVWTTITTFTTKNSGVLYPKAYVGYTNDENKIITNPYLTLSI